MNEMLRSTKVGGRIETTVAEGGKVNGATRKQVAGKLGKIFDCIRYSKYGNGGSVFLTVAELFGDLLSVGGLYLTSCYISHIRLVLLMIYVYVLTGIYDD